MQMEEELVKEHCKEVAAAYGGQPRQVWVKRYTPLRSETVQAEWSLVDGSRAEIPIECHASAADDCMQQTGSRL